MRSVWCHAVVTYIFLELQSSRLAPIDSSSYGLLLRLVIPPRANISQNVRLLYIVPLHLCATMYEY